jgi:hypothetical protein
MFKPPTVEEVDNELAELEKQLGQFNRLLERKQVLREYKSVLARLNPNGVARSAQELPAPSDHSNALGTSEVARNILGSSGRPMRLLDIVIEARKRGWKSSGENRRDMNRFFASMHRKSDVFQHFPGGLWTLHK